MVVMSLKMNMMLQKRDLMFRKERNVYSIIKSNTTISCKIKELPTQKKNLYQVLSLESRDVSFEEIKKAYRAKALQLHPNVCPISSVRDKFTKQFVELQKAYQVLLEPNSRRMYDNELILVESIGCGYGDDQKERFSRKVWELQLAGLQNRSAYRMERMKKEFTYE